MMGTKRILLLSILTGMLMGTGAFMDAAAADDVLKLGMIGLDTSHVVAFTELINNPESEDHVPGAKIVAAFKGGSPDIKSSWSRVDKYTEELQTKYGVKIVDTIPELCKLVDGVLIESVDGRPHLEQAKPVIAAGLPFFLDKPVAGSFKDIVEIARLAKKAGVPWFGGSSLRWWSGMREAIDPEKVGDILACDAYSPFHLEEHHPDLFWYGVHGVEPLYAAMGVGCQTVQRTDTENGTVVVGVWEGGRIGTFRGLAKGKGGYGVTVFGTKGVATASGHSYKGLVQQIVTFFQTKKPPIPPEETIELTGFMEAADDSKRQGGKPVPLPKYTLD